MNDGTTGIQVAPITEDDMNRVKSILQRAADAIVGMSQLKTDVDTLRTQVQGLQADCDRLRNQNNALDEALNHSRAVRDEQARELSQVKDKLASTDAENVSLRLHVQDLEAQVSDYKAKLEASQHEAAEWTDEADKAHHALFEAHNKLEAIREGFKSIFGHEPEAVQPLRDAPAEPEGATLGDILGAAKTKPADDGPHYDEQAKPSEPAPPPPPEVDWNRPYHWDPVKGTYFND